MTDEQARRLWREHCWPFIDAGAALVYGSPEHLAHLAAKDAPKVEPTPTIPDYVL